MVIRWKSGLAFIPLVFHVECYILWVTDNFNRRWNDWKMGVEPRKKRRKRGRKFIYSNREQAATVNRLKSLISYHKRAGNETRVSEIELLLGGIH